MRGGLVACLSADGDVEPRRVQAAAAALRWHVGEWAEHRLGGLSVICLTDPVDGPHVESSHGKLSIGHGAPAEPIGALQTRDRFAGIESDGRRLQAIRDPMGEVPLFYRRVGGELWLASEPEPLLTVAPVEPDLGWLAAYSAMVELPEATAWRGVRRVLPGTILEVDEHLQASTRRYFEPWQAGETAISSGEAAARLRALFTAAVAKRCVGKAGILLSGGLDSSAVAVVAAEHCKPTLLTLSHPDLPEVDETRFAEAVAQAAGLPLETVEVTPDAWDPHADLEATGMPMLGAPTGMHAQAFRAFAARGCDTVLDGHDGDGTLGGLYAWSGHTLLDLRFDRLLEAAREYGPRVILKDAVEDLVPRAIVARKRRRTAPRSGGRQSFLPYFRGQTAARLAHELRWRPPRRGWRDTQRRALLPPTTQHFEEVEMVAARFGIDVRHPFADRDLISFLITVPHAVKQSTTLLKPLLRAALSDLLPAVVAQRADKTQFAPVVDARVDFERCYLAIRDCPTRLPDIDYGRLFRDAPRPVADRMLWLRLASAHAFLTRNAA